MNTDPLVALIDRHLDGLASADDAEVLSRLLEEDPVARRLYLRKARLHAALGAAEASLTSDEIPAASRPALTRPRPLAWAASIVGLTTVSLLVWRLLVAPGWEARAAPVATLREIGDARWVTPEARFAAGDPLRAGQTLELSAGSAAVDFASGARVTLMGPSIFELTSENSGFLTLGQLKAEATTPASKGFTVRTRTARVVDIGTRFVAAAAPDGQSRIDVTDGEVDVLLDGSATTHRLRTGEALSVEAGSAQVLVRIEPGDGTAAFRFPTIPPPSTEDLADRKRGEARISVVRGNLRTNVPIPSGPAELLLDGRGQSLPDSPAESVFFDDDSPGTFLVDLGRPIAISRINTY
ncbi:MAG: FecR domain-containing protein, partial [Opitutaceae bacterium]